MHVSLSFSIRYHEYIQVLCTRSSAAIQVCVRDLLYFKIMKAVIIFLCGLDLQNIELISSSRTAPGSKP